MDFQRTLPHGATMRDEVRAIMEKYEDRDAEGLGGVIYFEGVTAEDAHDLLVLLPELRDEAQNESPTMEGFVDLANKLPGSLIHGYRVLPRREDERYSFEAINIPMESLTKEDIIELNQLGADEMGQDGDTLRLWWD